MGNAVLARYYVPKFAVGIQMLPPQKKLGVGGVLTTEANLLFQLSIPVVWACVQIGLLDTQHYNW